MKKKTYILLFIAITIAFTACEDIWLDCIEGNNNPVEVSRNISEFDELSVTGPFDVYVTRADSFSLRIDAEENLIPEVETRVTGERLYVETTDNHCLRNNYPIKIYVTASNIKEARLTGSGLIQIDSVLHEYFEIDNTGSGDVEIGYMETVKLDIRLTGSGDIEAKGSATETDIGLMGSGDVRLIDLEQDYTEVNLTGSGDTYVYVVEKLKAKIMGSGDIYYKGSPSIDSDITGSGKIRKY
jgi:hypothetical protein